METGKCRREHPFVARKGRHSVTLSRFRVDVNPMLDACSDQAHTLSQAVQKDAMDAVREALQYESMHEEMHEDEDVGDLPGKSGVPDCGMHAHCSMPSCGTMK